MSTDLKKMVGELPNDYGVLPIFLKLLKAIAEEIEANREEIERLKTKLSTCHSMREGFALLVERLESDFTKEIYKRAGQRGILHSLIAEARAALAEGEE